SFRTAATVSTSPFGGTETFADFNNDGVLDIAGGNSGTIFTLLQNLDSQGRRNNFENALDLTSIQGARRGLVYTSALLDSISLELGNIGSYQSRLRTSFATLQKSSLENRTAYHRIIDSDVAQDSASLIRNQIRQQAGAAVLAQANQQP